MINGSSIDYQWYSTVIILCSKFAYFHRVGGWVGGWVGGRNLIIKTISAELDCAELGNRNIIKACKKHLQKLLKYAKGLLETC